MVLKLGTTEPQFKNPRGFDEPQGVQFKNPSLRTPRVTEPQGRNETSFAKIENLKVIIKHFRKPEQNLPSGQLQLNVAQRI